ncbi:glycine cleavage system protein GcvH [Roseofilum casamattae]|uniref:Glycine cleavage system H protein n=1 Tax=Roseofilum casamattae BLCC-M143 TaxID=3022442 RepID=A0ABT7C231_9CYAN|nr:glycine cleavage system protein GcvH [Roseofilum casamattae]MDJ1185345.1 glycine cleavage system protein GcvH [Roseofilum casamattae BLCC-M143]
MELDYPNELKYLDSHEYVRLDGEIAIVGLSAFAIDQLGDVVHIELPEAGDKIAKSDDDDDEGFGSIESVKAVESLKSPVSGTVLERNETILDEPEAIADDPYGEGWLIKVKIENPEDLDDLLSATEYRSQLQADEEE